MENGDDKDGDSENDDEEEDEDDEYVVEKILDERINPKTKKLEYLVKWAGYDSESDNTWEPVENCVSSSVLFSTFSFFV